MPFRVCAALKISPTASIFEGFCSISKEQGYEVIGATMQLWRTEEQQKQSPDESGGVEDILEARKVAKCLGIPHYVMNFYNSFQEKVVDKFTSEYLRGMTPNPCVI